MISALASSSGTYRLLPNSSDKILVFDIETNGLLYSKNAPVSTVWCVVIYDCKQKTYYTYKPESIETACEHLASADILIGHNIIGYDIPVLHKLYPNWTCKAQPIDTFVLANLVFPKDKLIELDHSAFTHLEGRLKGSQSLRAWGQRLQNLKGDHSNWSEFSEEMLTYCQNDVLVSTLLYTYLVRVLKEKDPELADLRSVAIEHDISQILALQVETGWVFDVDRALDLNDTLKQQLEVITQELSETIPAEVKQETFVPKKDNKTRGYKAGVPIVKETVIPFNPGSRKQILTFFKQRYNWVPSERTEKGNYKLNDDILSELPFPEAKQLADYFLLQKRIGQLSDGNKSWLGLVDQNNLIHGSIISNGCVSGRSTHSDPNMAQVPNVDAAYGPECRALFKPRDGFLLMGSDAKALELRCLGGYLAYFDDGEYASKVIDPDVDIHSYNQEKFGVETRSIAKRLIYCVPVDCTLLLTPDGWKPYHDLKIGQDVLTYNQRTHAKEWSPILAIIPAYEDTVYEISNHSMRFEATSEHRWFAGERPAQGSTDCLDLKEITTAEITESTFLLVDGPMSDCNLKAKNALTFNYFRSGFKVKPMGRRAVFCVTTANDSFVMQQHKSITITGNCVLYGGGATKTGSIIEPHSSPARQKQIGIDTLNNFYKEIPALKKLKDQVESTIESRGYLKGLDGRYLHVRSAYKGLNLLLQSAGAIIMKRVGIEIYEKITNAGYVYGVDWCQNAFVHDEYQISVMSHCINQVRELVLDAYPSAGRFLSFRCPIEGDVKIGSNWYETH